TAAPRSARALAPASDRVMPVTLCPRRTSSATRGRPIAPLAPATKTFMVILPRWRPVLLPRPLAVELFSSKDDASGGLVTEGPLHRHLPGDTGGGRNSYSGNSVHRSRGVDAERMRGRARHRIRTTRPAWARQTPRRAIARHPCSTRFATRPTTAQGTRPVARFGPNHRV